MSDERMKAAERWIADRQERILAGDKTALFGGVDAYLAGHRAAREEASREIEAMTQRARDGAPLTCYGLDDLAAKIRGEK